MANDMNDIKRRLLYFAFIHRALCAWLSIAFQLTHTILSKELKHCRHLEDLEVNENVKGKAKDFVSKYMSKFGPIYKPSIGSP